MARGLNSWRNNKRKQNMKMTKIVTLAAAVIVTARVGMAQETVHVWSDPNQWWTEHWTTAPAATPKFTASELSLDAFGSFLAPERKFADIFDTDIRKGKWGGGLGVNYFFARAIGIGVDANVPDNGGNFIDSVSGSLIARLPWEGPGLAPYIFGGGGRRTDPVWEWTGHAGLGLEWRMNPVTGIFFDTRYIWADKTTDQILFRGGLRFVF
jgi:hypothetical protein